MTLTDPTVREPRRHRPRGRDAVLPPGLGRPAAVLAVVCALAVAGEGFLVRGTSQPGPLDVAARAAVRSRLTPGPFAYDVDGLVAPVPALVTVGILVLACLALRRTRLAVVAVAGPLGSYLVTSTVKPLVGRTIHGDNLSFPSGHVAFATAVGLVIGLLVIGRPRLGRVPDALLALLVGLLCGLAMAVDQILVDAHYATDTLGGILTAVAVVLGAGLTLDPLAARLRRDP